MMKKLIVFAFLFSFMLVYPQGKELPQAVEAAFKSKNPGSKFSYYRVDNNLYYLEFNFKGHLYTSVFNKMGDWIETSEIISDIEIPKQLKDYINDRFIEAVILYCEKVETPDSLFFIRIGLSNKEKFTMIQCDNKGDNIRISEDNL